MSLRRSDRARSKEYAMQLNTYATLSAFRQRQALAASDTGDDDRMLAKLRSATAQIDRFTGRSFIPTVATRKFNWHNARTLLFRGYDLLELTSITNGDGTSVDPTAIIALGGVNGPIVGVELDLTRAFFVYLTTKTRALTVNGVWGWHDDLPTPGNRRPTLFRVVGSRPAQCHSRSPV